MPNTGKITVINNDLKYGFVQVAKVGDVFFSAETRFEGTAFESLKLNDSVKISIKDTDRGPFAESLRLDIPKRKERTQDISI